MIDFNPIDFISQLSIDCVIFGYKDKALKVLIPRLLISPEMGSLPGGFIKNDESIDTAARRILKERTAIDNIYLEQFRVFGERARVNHEINQLLKSTKEADLEKLPFGAEEALQWLSKRFVSIGYYALVDIRQVNPQCTAFDASVDWFSIDELPPLIMDHKEMIHEGLKSLRQHLDEKLIAFNLLPETFTMRELQELYEAVYDKPFPRNNFQKKMLDLNVLERLEKKFTGAANKAPYLYRFRR